MVAAISIVLLIGLAFVLVPGWSTLLVIILTAGADLALRYIGRKLRYIRTLR